MRIGVLTYCIGQNYGALLQAYATMVALRELAHEVVFIYYHQSWSKGPSFFRLSSYLSPNPRRMLGKWARMYRHFLIRRQFKKMERMFPKTKRYYRSSLDALKANPPECDVYLAGSDQVWNCQGGFSAVEAYFLPFGNESVRRVSYASSLGGNPIPLESQSRVRSYLSRFHAISVRENESVAYLASIGSPGAVWVPDPTLLLSAENYAELMQSGDEEAAAGLVYILKAGGADITRIVKAWVGDCPTVLNIALNGFKIDFGVNRIVTVPGFVRAVARSRRVVTNSFHCTVFSILFHRPFIVISLTGAYANMNERLVSFLAALGLSDRLVSVEERARIPALLAQDIDWASVDQAVERLRVRGWDFLRQALATNP